MSKAKYQPGIVAEVMSWGEVAVTFRNVAQFGLGYRRGTLTIGAFDPKTGTIDSHCDYGAMPFVSEVEALRILEQERDLAFTKEFAPKVALVVNGKVMVKGRSHQKVSKPYEYHLTGDTYIATHRKDAMHSKSTKAPIELTVYGTDIMQISGITIPNTKNIRAHPVGNALEKTLGLRYEDISIEIATPDLYISGHYLLHGDASFQGDSVEFKPAENIAVLVRREQDKNLTLTTLNPTLKRIFSERLAQEAVELARSEKR